MISHGLYFPIIRCLDLFTFGHGTYGSFFSWGGAHPLILYQFLCMGGSVSFLISILFFLSFSPQVGFLVAMIGQRPLEERAFLGGEDTCGPRITYSSAPPPPDLFFVCFA